MDTKEALQLFAALLAIMNPLTVVPRFSGADRRIFRGGAAQGGAGSTAITAFVALAVVLVAGTGLLDLFGITINDFRIAGGIMLFIMSLSLLRAKPSRMRYRQEEEIDAQQHDNPAVFPLAIPMMAGPGSMTTVILFGDEYTGTFGIAVAMAVIAVVCLIILTTLSLANWLAREVGVTGMNVVTRLMGMILSAVAVGMISQGLRGAFPVLGGG